MSTEDPGDGGVTEVTPTNLRYDPDADQYFYSAGADDGTLAQDEHGTRIIRGSANVDADHNQVERSIDGGASWEPVADQLPLTTTLTDPECLVGRGHPTMWRVWAVSLTPSSASTVVELEADDRSMWLSGGDGFQTVVRLPYNPSVKISSGLVERQVQHFAGRTLGTEMSGSARQRKVSIGSLLIEEDPTSTSSTSEQVEELSYLPAPILYRDPTGRRIYASMGMPDVSRDHLLRWKLSVELEEVGRD